MRYKLSSVLVSVQRVVNLPLELVQASMANFASKKNVLKVNEQLRTKLLLLNTELQRLSFLEHENSELRALLDLTRQTTGKVLSAEIVTLATDKFVHHVTINRGEQHGVKVGQPVLDAYGLLGQVVVVKPNMSMVMLVTNSKSAVPVTIVRSNLQAVAVGADSGDYLELANISETIDVKVGDILVTSGLGRIFPAGYQVGVVKEIRKIWGERFMRVFVAPKAHINRSLHVFLVSSLVADTSLVL